MHLMTRLCVLEQLISNKSSDILKPFLSQQIDVNSYFYQSLNFPRQNLIAYIRLVSRLDNVALT